MIPTIITVSSVIISAALVVYACVARPVSKGEAQELDWDIGPAADKDRWGDHAERVPYAAQEDREP